MKPLDHFPYQSDSLRAESVPIESIVETVGTPCYIYSKQALHSAYQKLEQHLRAHLQDPLICFAVKASSTLSVLDLYRQWGAGLDLVSGGELFRAKAIQMPPDRIVFSGVGKTVTEIQSALSYGETGIFSFNVESVEECKVLDQVASSMGKTARVAFRFNPNVDAKTHPYIATGLKKNKFGLDMHEILSLVPWLKRAKAIQVVGLSIHIGSQILKLKPFEDAFSRLAKAIVELNGLLPKPLEFVDVGGGIGVPYRSEVTPSIQKYAELLGKTFGTGGLGLRVVCEPGRFLTANAGVLVSRVLYRKQRKDKHFLILDAGMNDLMRPSLYGSYHGIVPVRRKRGGLHKFDVVGPVCESSDCFAEGRPLPSTLVRDDLVAILSAGAYGFSMANTYNTRPRPPEILVDGDQFRVIRARETYEDLLKGESK